MFYMEPTEPSSREGH